MIPDELSEFHDGEINRMIAERLGWTELDEHEGQGVGRSPDDPSCFRCVPEYCTDLNAAWELTAKQFASATFSICQGGGNCMAIILRGDKILASDTFHATAPHPARAIIIAYLLATEGK